MRNHFREDLADYAVGSILFGLGVQESVTTPSDHGFDPVEHGRGAVSPGAGGRKARSEEEVKDRVEENAGGGANEWGAGVTRREPSAEKEKETEVSTPGIFRGGSAAPRNAGAKSTSSSLKWMIALVLLAGGFAGGWLTGSSFREDSGIPDHQMAGSAAGNSVDNDLAGNSAQEVYVPGKAYYADSGEKKQFLPLTDAHGKELPAESDVAPFRKPNGGAGKKSSYADEQQAEAARKEAETMAKAEAEAKQRP